MIVITVKNTHKDGITEIVVCTVTKETEVIVTGAGVSIPRSDEDADAVTGREEVSEVSGAGGVIDALVSVPPVLVVVSLPLVE